MAYQNNASLINTKLNISVNLVGMILFIIFEQNIAVKLVITKQNMKICSKISTKPANLKAVFREGLGSSTFSNTVHVPKTSQHTFESRSLSVSSLSL